MFKKIAPCINRYYKFFIISFILVFNINIFAIESCKKLGRSGETVYMYCPESMTINQVTSFLKNQIKSYVSKNSNVVQIIIFDTIQNAPKSTEEFLYKVDDNWIDTHRIAISIYSKNDGITSYDCKMNKNSEIMNCICLINKTKKCMEYNKNK